MSPHSFPFTQSRADIGQTETVFDEPNHKLLQLKKKKRKKIIMQRSREISKEIRMRGGEGGNTTGIIVIKQDNKAEGGVGKAKARFRII